MLKYFSANYIFPVTSLPIKDGIVAIDDKGEIQGIFEEKDFKEDVPVKKLKGIIIPGFINTHCHIELSHMKGEIKKETGLVDFLISVMTSRKASLKEIDKAMEKADKEMYDNGIVAVGDHVNTDNSSKLKAESKLLYHTFVELMGIEKEEADFKLHEAKSLAEEFPSPHVSITPHAPYSVSKDLFKKLKKQIAETNILSIHNQESEEENKLFRYRTGEFLAFYDKIGKNAEAIKAQARNSIQSYLSYLPNPNKLILVHNTFTSLKDIDFVERMGKSVVWCLCPKANMYIEGVMPKVYNFIHSGQLIALGTDSLASNDTLSIFDELKTLHNYYKDLDFIQTIKWATINGAKALNIEDKFGSIEVGKTPGLVLLEGMENFKLTDDIKVKRIA